MEEAGGKGREMGERREERWEKGRSTLLTISIQVNSSTPFFAQLDGAEYPTEDDAAMPPITT
jgi:hypothetical protein